MLETFDHAALSGTPTFSLEATAVIRKLNVQKVNARVPADRWTP